MGIKTLITEDWRKRRLIQQFRKIERKFGGDVAIRGSYTGNLGDILIGEVIKDNLKENGRKGKLFSGIHEDFSNYNYLILGGGSIIRNSASSLGSQREAAESVSNFSIHGVGVRNIDLGNYSKVNFLKKADKISVRDKKSKENLLEAIDVDVKVTADPVFSLNSKYGKNVKKEAIAVNFRPLRKNYFYMFDEEVEESPQELMEKYDEYCRRLWKSLNEDYEHVEFIPFDTKDVRFAKRLDLEPRANLMKPRPLIKYIDENFSKIVSTRYHALITALITGKEVIPISYATKVEELCERLDLDYHPIYELPENREYNFQKVENSKIKDLEKMARSDFKSLIEQI